MNSHSQLRIGLTRGGGLHQLHATKETITPNEMWRCTQCTCEGMSLPSSYVHIAEFLILPFQHSRTHAHMWDNMAPCHQILTFTFMPFSLSHGACTEQDLHESKAALLHYTCAKQIFVDCTLNGELALTRLPLNYSKSWCEGRLRG